MKPKFRFIMCNYCGQMIDVNLDPEYVFVGDRHRKAYYHSRCVELIQWDSKRKIIEQENER